MVVCGTATLVHLDDECVQDNLWSGEVLDARADVHSAASSSLVGYSDKPDPRTAPTNSIYCFPTWGEQLADFIVEVVRSPAFISTNSVGGLAGLCAAATAPEGAVRGVQLIDISLRGLHVKRQNAFQRPFVAALQRVSDAGFSSVRVCTG